MNRTLRGAMTLVLAAALGSSAAGVQAAAPTFSPGAPGVGDPYYPLDGNGGYDVGHYDLDVAYAPSSDTLSGVATITATATQNLSRFDLDLVALKVRKVTVDGSPATWNRQGQELVITPASGIARGAVFTTVVRYDGVPQPVTTAFGISGVLHTDDGLIIAGQPHAASTWFPVNDHPSDKASYTFQITAPQALDVTSNGILTGKKRLGARTRWTWQATEPMASYLTTMAIGDYALTSRTAGGLPYVDAIDRDLFTPFAQPATGSQFALSQAADSSYKRLSRTISVPTTGASVSFTLARDTEPTYDFVFVEARTVGLDDWTTLADVNGHTSSDPGSSCVYENWITLHPALAHYQTYIPATGADPSCSSSGTTGQWFAASGASTGYENWQVDLARYAGKRVELSLSYASDEIVQDSGLFVDDVVVSTGAGTTSFEADADPLDGWTVPGAPVGSPPNENDWVVGTVAVGPPTTGDIARGSLDREPEIIAFLAKNFGPYPFSTVGGIVSDDERLQFALETQTRPVYSPLFFANAASGDSVVVHELAHQWFGDSLALKRWKDIWLNEGFATYAEWLWSEREGNGTTQEIFDSWASIPADEDGFWGVTIGDPGPDLQFDGAVYNRGAMTLQALRSAVGDRAFFRILREWAASKEAKNVSKPQFIALAERISGRTLDAFFTTWLYTPAKPSGIEPAGMPQLRTGQEATSLEALNRRFGDRVHSR